MDKRISVDDAVELLEENLAHKPGYPKHENLLVATRELRATGREYADAASDKEHAHRMMDKFLASPFFPRLPEIQAAANATRLVKERDEHGKVQTYQPITAEELESPEIVEAARIMGCEPKDLFGDVGERPRPAGFFRSFDPGAAKKGR